MGSTERENNRGRQGLNELVIKKPCSCRIKELVFYPEDAEEATDGFSNS